jgi:hypothetical protein
LKCCFGEHFCKTVLRDERETNWLRDVRKNNYDFHHLEDVLAAQETNGVAKNNENPIKQQ